MCTMMSHSADHHQENSGATGLIFVTYVTRQHSQILHTCTVVIFMSVSKYTIAVTLKKK